MRRENPRRTPTSAVIGRLERLAHIVDWQIRVAAMLAHCPSRCSLYHLACITQKHRIRALSDSSQCLDGSLTKQGIIGVRRRLNLPTHRWAGCIPDLVQLLELCYRIARQALDARRIPATRPCSVRKIRAQSEDGHLRFAEGRSEVFERLQRIHPAAELLLPRKQILNRFRHLRIRSRNARSLERPKCVTRLKLHFWLAGFEPH